MNNKSMEITIPTMSNCMDLKLKILMYTSNRKNNPLNIKLNSEAFFIKPLAFNLIYWKEDRLEIPSRVIVQDIKIKLLWKSG